MCFNIPNNDFCINKTKYDNYFDKNKTDYKARNEFLAFMKENFPKVGLYEIFGTAPIGVLVYPYLGSIAVDCEKEMRFIKL
ncbi:hypothetical protein V6G57_000990 [Campylobacter jejuni]